MNTNLTQVIIETIEQSKSILGEGLSLAKEQTPLVVNEFLIWKFWESLITGIAWMLIAIIALYCSFRLVKWAAKCIREDSDDILVLPVGIACIVLFIPWFFSISLLKESLQIKIAPRVYLIEYVAKTVSK